MVGPPGADGNIGTLPVGNLTQRGIVQLTNDVSQREDLALTPRALNELKTDLEDQISSSGGAGKTEVGVYLDHANHLEFTEDGMALIPINVSRVWITACAGGAGGGVSGGPSNTGWAPAGAGFVYKKEFLVVGHAISGNDYQIPITVGKGGVGATLHRQNGNGEDIPFMRVINFQTSGTSTLIGNIITITGGTVRDSTTGQPSAIGGNPGGGNPRGSHGSGPFSGQQGPIPTDTAQGGRIVDLDIAMSSPSQPVILAGGTFTTAHRRAGGSLGGPGGDSPSGASGNFDAGRMVPFAGGVSALGPKFNGKSGHVPTTPSQVPTPPEGWSGSFLNQSTLYDNRGGDGVMGGAGGHAASFYYTGFDARGGIVQGGNGGDGYVLIEWD